MAHVTIEAAGRGGPTLFDMSDPDLTVSTRATRDGRTLVITKRADVQDADGDAIHLVHIQVLFNELDLWDVGILHVEGILFEFRTWTLEEALAFCDGRDLPYLPKRGWAYNFHKGEPDVEHVRFDTPAPGWEQRGPRRVAVVIRDVTSDVGS